MFKLENIIETSKKAYIVDIEVNATEVYSLTVLTRKGKDIDFSFPVVESSDINDILGKIPDEATIGLIISGKGVLYRVVKSGADSPKEKLLSQILPDADVNDFHIQPCGIEGKGETSIVSIARKEVVDNLIAKFSGKGFISGISIGPFIFNTIIPLFEEHVQSISYKYIQIEITDDAITGFQTNGVEGTTVHINGQDIKTDLLPSLALGFSLLMGSPCNYAEIPSIGQFATENRFREKSIKIIRYTIPITFLVLMASYILFDTYFGKVENIKADIAENEQQLKQLEELRESYASKNKFLEQSGLLGHTQTSKYLDLIAQKIPATIVLSEINVNPLQKSHSYNKEMTFKRNTIEISGTSIESYVFNTWIKELKESHLFKEVNILQYEYKEKEGRAYFKINIIT